MRSIEFNNQDEKDAYRIESTCLKMTDYPSEVMVDIQPGTVDIEDNEDDNEDDNQESNMFGMGLDVETT